jgi:hypothetical protein
MRNQIETFEKLSKLHNDIYAFRAKLEAIEAISEIEKLSLLVEANKIVAPCGGAYGEYTYLFEACGIRFGEIYQDFWDRLDEE